MAELAVAEAAVAPPLWAAVLMEKADLWTADVCALAEIVFGRRFARLQDVRATLGKQR